MLVIIILMIVTILVGIEAVDDRNVDYIANDLGDDHVVDNDGAKLVMVLMTILLSTVLLAMILLMMILMIATLMIVMMMMVLARTMLTQINFERRWNGSREATLPRERRRVSPLGDKT